MQIPVAVREALELQILEAAPERAATVVGTAVAEHGAVPVANALLDAASIALRRMVAATDEAYDLAELLARLALDGAVPEHRLELLTDILTAAAATAGGIRPPVDALHTRLGEQDLLFGAWLGLLTAAAATAGGIRPPVDALHTRLGEQDLLFGAWLGLLTALRVASLAMEITETELLEDVLLVVDIET